MFRVVILLMALLMLYGCASMFCPINQDVTIVTNNDNTRVYVDTAYIGMGNKQIASVFKDCKSKQVRVEADSCKTEYKVIFQESKSNWNILSYLPFIIIPMADFLSNSWVFKDSYEIKPLRKYVYWTNKIKHIEIDNIDFDMKKENSIIYFYKYYHYIDNDPPSDSNLVDIDKFKNINFEKLMKNRLKQLKFIDSVESVFMDNENTLVLDCTIKNLTFKGIYKNYLFARLSISPYDIISNPMSYYVIADMKSTWTLKDIYDDTLYTVDVYSNSGEIAVDKNITSDNYKYAINDAIENSFIDLMNLPKITELLKVDSIKINEYNEIQLTRPSKSPTNIDEAMKASFTIKSDGGHGSGFLISHDGYIITNYHVVNNEKNLKAIDGDGKEFPVHVVRFNKSVDLALLKIEANFEFAFTIPDEKNFNTGQDVYAVGTPKSVELGQTTSKGIISGFRTNKNVKYIQTDIGINKGNSGGAVINSAGELIGVVKSKLIGVGTEGISFSIPAFNIMKSLTIMYQP